MCCGVKLFAYIADESMKSLQRKRKSTGFGKEKSSFKYGAFLMLVEPVNLGCNCTLQITFLF